MAAGHSQRRRGVGAGSPSSASSPNSVRAELVEAPSFPRPREKTERPFDKLRPNGLEGAASGSARTGSGFSNTDARNRPALRHTVSRRNTELRSAVSAATHWSQAVEWSDDHD